MAECSGFSNAEGSSLNSDNKVEGCGESRLGKHLEKAFIISVEKLKKTLSLSLFQQHYKEVHENNPEALEELHRQLIEQVETGTRNEFSRFCKEREIGPLLESLDEQIIKFKDNEGNQAWRPSEDPEENVRDFFYDIMAKHNELLKTRLEKTESENEKLLQLVKKNHEEVLALQANLASAISSRQEMNTALHEVAISLEDAVCGLIDEEDALFDKEFQTPCH